MRFRCFAVVIPLLAALPAQAPIPSADNFAAWRDHVLPASAELRWLEIPWRSTFAEGLQAASEQGRPFLFWAMNGHPLGCT